MSRMGCTLGLAFVAMATACVAPVPSRDAPTVVPDRAPVEAPRVAASTDPDPQPTPPASYVFFNATDEPGCHLRYAPSRKYYAATFKGFNDFRSQVPAEESRRLTEALIALESSQTAADDDARVQPGHVYWYLRSDSGDARRYLLRLEDEPAALTSARNSILEPLRVHRQALRDAARPDACAPKGFLVIDPKCERFECGRVCAQPRERGRLCVHDYECESGSCTGIDFNGRCG